MQSNIKYTNATINRIEIKYVFNLFNLRIKFDYLN